MENKLAMTILGSIMGIIVMVPIGFIFGGLVTGIVGALTAGAGAYFAEYLIVWVKAHLRK
jgi:hypothetical protein